MTKVFLKDTNLDENIMTVAKKLKADYFENEFIYFICPKKYGDSLMGIGFDPKDNQITFGLIDEKSKDFLDLPGNSYLLEEQTWIISVLNRIKFYLNNLKK